MIIIEKDAVHIDLEREINDSYSIFFGRGLFKQIAEEQKARWPKNSKFAIITDSNVRKLYAGSLEETLKNEGLNVNVFSFEAGEQNKRMETYLSVIGQMSGLEYGRDSVILALGGGVVGDMAGLIAALFNRGVPCIQVPTTVLAQADASVGGKTAVDTEHGKNIIGAFKQPAAVYVDVSTLKTLSDRDYVSGMAETIKHGIIETIKYGNVQERFFDYLWKNSGLILQRDSDALLHTSKRNCIIKGNVVQQDPEEKGLRRILNYGHTIGHAVEKLSGFKLPHGEAVSIGMVAEGNIAVMLGYFSPSELARQENLLLRFGLPVKIPEGMSDEAIIEATSVDKKAAGGRARYALPSSIGKMLEFGGAYATFVDGSVVKAALHATR